MRGFKLTSMAPDVGIRASSVALGTSVVDDVVIETVYSGVSILNSTGTLDITNATITGATGRGFEISGGSPTVSYDGTIVSSAGIMIRAENTTGGSAAFTGGPFVASGGEGVTAFNADGDVSVESARIGPGSFRGVNLVNSDGAFTFTELGINGTDSIGFNVDGGTPDVNAGLALGTLLNVNHHAVQIQNTTNGVVRFTGGPIIDNGGWGIEIQNTSGTFVDFQGPVTLIDPDLTYAQAGLYLDNVGGPVTFADLTINTSSATGLVHRFSTGTLTVLDGNIAATETQAIDVQNATVVLDLATVSVNSSNPDYGGIEYQNSVGSNTLIGTLTLDVSDLTPLRLTTAGVFNVGDGTVTVVNSPAALISGTSLGVNLSSLSTDNSFVQGLQILTSSGSFVAADGLIENSADEAVYLSSNNGLFFVFDGTIDNNSANSVFVLNNTGGSTFQFGDITDIGAGIVLNNNSGTSTRFLGDLDVSTDDDIALYALNGNNVTIQGLSNFLASANSDGVFLSELEGLNVIASLTASSGSGQALHFGQSSGAATLQITNSKFDDSFFGTGVSALASGTATATLDISGSTLSRNGSSGLDVTASDNAVLNLILDGGNTLDQNNEAVVARTAFGGTLNVDIDGNTITNQGYRGIYLDAGATATGDLTGFVRNNTIDGAGDGEGIYVLGSGTNATAAVEITNNSVRNTAGSGIVVENQFVTGNAADMAATLFGNSVDVDPSFDIGIQLSSWQRGTMCARVGGPTAPEQNSFVGIGGGSAFSVEESGSLFQLERLALGAQSAPAVVTQLTADNPALAGNSVDVFTSSGIVGVAVGTCRTPLVVP